MLDQELDDLFCPWNVQLEHLADEFLTGVIKIILNKGTMTQILSQFHKLYNTQG